MKESMSNSVSDYFHETLGIRLDCRRWSRAKELPHAIGGSYEFAEADILGTSILLMTLKDPASFLLAQIMKHMDWIEERFGTVVILCLEGLDSYNRKRLIEQKAAFVIPGNQMYLPTLGVDLRDHIRKLREKGDSLTPSAQMILLHHLLAESENDLLNATLLAAKFGMSRMTMGRAIDELSAHRLIETRVDKRRKYVVFQPSKRQIWEDALPLMTTPVGQEITVENRDGLSVELGKQGLQAGLSALSVYSPLADTGEMTLAFRQGDKNQLLSHPKVQTVPAPSRGLIPGIAIEFWKYDPRKLASGPTVDPLSLYLSLRNDPDERVESSLETLLKETMPWLRD
jgi:DNA-binding MarR family transcriptional regulator